MLQTGRALSRPGEVSVGIRRRSLWPETLLSMLVLAVVAGCAAKPPIPRWDPPAFRDANTLEFLTVGPEEGPHWSTVWLVVVDDQVYVRLGSRAAERMQKNTAAPDVGVRIGGREYQRVRAEETPAMATRVAVAMGEKYPSDLLIRYFPHPLTMRLTPPADAP